MSRLREEGGRLLELSALVGVAVAQPILGPFGESPQTFIASGASGSDILEFGLAVAVVPILVLGAAGAATRLLGPNVRSWVHTTTVAGLAALGGVAVARDAGLTDSGGSDTIVLSALAGVGFVAAGLLHRRAAWASTYLRFASPLPIALLALFLFASPVAPLLRSTSASIDRVDADHPDVVMVVLDELPTMSLIAGGEIDGELFPNLARFAGTSTWYRNNTSVATHTVLAAPALVTGRLPDRIDRLPNYADHPDNLFSLLAPTHRLHAVEWATDLCPNDLCPEPTTAIDDVGRRLAPGLLDPPDAPLPSLLGEARSLWWSQAWPAAAPRPRQDVEPAVSGAEDLVRAGLRFLAGLEDTGDGRPVLDYLHAPVPHQPWQLLPDGRFHEAPWPPPGAEFFVWPEGEIGAELTGVARMRHVLQLQWADRLLGAIIDRLQELGRWDDSVVVVTSDHGVSFEPGSDLREVSTRNQVDVAWAPLLIKAPGQRAAAVVDDNVLSVDVLPTIAELVDVDVPWEVDGRSLVGGPPRADSAPKPVFPRIETDLEPIGDTGLVELSADGLDALLARPAAPTGDPLRVWRHGVHGDVVGARVDQLGVCRGGDSTIAHDAPDGWGEFVASGTTAPGEPLPLWHDVVVRGPAPTVDVAAVIDGVVVGWGSTWANLGAGAVGGILLAEPLVGDLRSELGFFEILDEPGAGGCRLRTLAAGDP